MLIPSLIESFKESFPKTLTERKVGLEYEYPVVFSDGNGVSFDVIRHLWKGLEQKGWTILNDSDTKAPVSACKRAGASLGTRNYECNVITLEFGFHTLEVNLAPSINLNDSASALSDIISIVTRLLEECGAHLIGHGVQPLSVPNAEKVSPRGRYRIIERSWIDSPDNLFDVYLLSLSAACQTHVDISKSEAIPLLNAFNLTAGLRIALFSNSKIWRGVESSDCATRELFWDWCYGARKKQIGIPKSFENLDSYVLRIMDFRGLMTRRDSEYFQLDNDTSFREYICREQNSVTDVTGKKVILKPSTQDMDIQWGLAWYDTRLQPAYSTIEDRCTCTQPPDGHLAASAFFLGLVENPGRLIEMADSYCLDDWRQIRLLACHKGLQMFRVRSELGPLVEDLLKAAHEGLKKRQFGEEIYLEPLYERLEHAQSPAYTSASWFRNGGICNFVKLSDMGSFSI